VTRKDVSTSDEQRRVFDRLADLYDCRPRYPDALITRLVELAGGPGAAVVDLGAGTGHLALPLALAGLRVTAIEPATRMLEVFVEKILELEPGVEVNGVDAPAEDTWQAPASFDLAVLADVLPWIDPDLVGRELRRILVAGGRVAVVEVELVSNPFLDAVVALLRLRIPRAFPERNDGRSDRLRRLLAAAGASTPSEEVLDQDVPVPLEAVPGLLTTTSFIGPTLDTEAMHALGEQAQDVASRLGGAVWSRKLRLTYARLR
jgi:ubiquinone/menaquinone biosynthesis C-methylase UbiE